MKILHTVEAYSPSVGGMQEVVRQLSERLARLGHDMTVATSKHSERLQKVINGVKIAEFSVSGNLACGLTGNIEEYKNFLVHSDFEVITNFASQQWATDVALLSLNKIKAKKVFVPTGFSALHSPQYQKYFEQLKTWMHLYDMNVFLSDEYRDSDFARRNGVNNRILIPNGAGADEFTQDFKLDIRKKLNIPRNHFLILHVGSHTNLKGHKEAIKIFRKARIKNATFIIVANDSGKGCKKACRLAEKIFNISLERICNKKRFLMTSLSREGTICLYKEADLFLFPSNIECSPLVLFECMASKTPFLTTDVGNAAEIIKWSQSGILLPTKKDAKGLSMAEIDKSIKILENIYADEQKRENMKQCGYTVWLERFTWEKIAKEYENLYLQLLMSPCPSCWKEKDTVISC